MTQASLIIGSKTNLAAAIRMLGELPGQHCKTLGFVVCIKLGF
ncbi:hypothetical protein [Halopseudomonas aestusnigri]